MDLVVVTACWKRPDVFEVFAKGIKRLGLPCVVAGSEGHRSKNMVEKHGFKYIEVPNNPLSEKHNIAMRLAKQMQPKYVLCLGSDDLISPGLLEVYRDKMSKGIDFIGLTDFYFKDTGTGKTAYWGGYIDKRKGHTVGAGRVISARLLDIWNWSPWEKRHSHVLDDSMQNKLKLIPHTQSIFKLTDYGVYAMDIKTHTNMTPFQLWPNTNYCKDDGLRNVFPWAFE